MNIFTGAPLTPVFSYLRVSGSGQVDGDGPERQREAITRFCKSYNLKLVGEFFDRAVSGTVEAIARPQFSELLDYADSRASSNSPISAIVVERMDRLARDLMVSEFLLAECRKRNLKVFSADQGVLLDMASDGGDPTRVLIRQILGALAQWEKTMLVTKLRAARVRKRETTGRCEGKKRYGFRPGEQDIINIAHNFRGVLDEFHQPMELAVIAKHLNEAGFRTRHGKMWDRFRVAHLIKNSTPTKFYDVEP